MQFFIKPPLLLMHELKYINHAKPRDYLSCMKNRCEIFKNTVLTINKKHYLVSVEKRKSRFEGKVAQL